MRKLIDLTGLVFGKVTVLNKSDKVPTSTTFWDCICSCGNKKIISGENLKRGITKSCGCLKGERTIQVHTKHGCARSGKVTPEFSAWQSMISRCYNPNDKRFPSHGQRGISVCNRWRHSFENFLKDMGTRPPQTKTREYSLDRKRNNGNYTPKNCRWATAKEQAANRRSNTWIVYKNKKSILQYWADLFGAYSSNLVKVIKARGLEDAFEYYINKKKVKVL